MLDWAGDLVAPPCLCVLEWILLPIKCLWGVAPRLTADEMFGYTCTQYMSHRALFFGLDISPIGPPRLGQSILRAVDQCLATSHQRPPRSSIDP